MLLAVTTSCKKTTNVDVELSTSGKLTYKLTDDAGKGLPNVAVSLFDRQGYYNSDVLLDKQVTDANGQVDFGDLNPSNYMLVADSAKVNNVSYNVQEWVQVITGSVKEKATKVTDFSGTLTVRVYSNNNNQPLKNIGILIIPSNKYNYSSPTSSHLKNADFSGLTNDAGLATFKIPSNKDYTVYLYNTVTNAQYNHNYNYLSIQKGSTIDHFINVYQP